VRFTLSRAARVQFTLLRRAAGRRVGTVCRKPAASYVRRPRCDLPLAGSFTIGATAGANRARFSGRLRSARLKPGRYWLRAAPRDAAGNEGKAKRTAITILRG
jgi:hypothetical protein